MIYRDSDAAVMDAGDIYTAGYIYDLIPVLSEVYNLEEPEYYAVAVAYQGDADTELTYLKGEFLNNLDTPYIVYTLLCFFVEHVINILF